MQQLAGQTTGVLGLTSLLIADMMSRDAEMALLAETFLSVFSYPLSLCLAQFS